MTESEIVQMIANEVEDHTQEEINAMMLIVSKIHGIPANLLFRMVGNRYHAMTREQRLAASPGVSDGYMERDPR